MGRKEEVPREEAIGLCLVTKLQVKRPKIRREGGGERLGRYALW